jgi:PBP1b-binding outer membrane lipoprotein LpoB
MKTMKLLTLVVLSTFILTSCSSNENLPSEASEAKLLKSYKVKRDISGGYSIEYDLEKNTTSKKVLNHKTKTNEFHFYKSDFGISKRVSDELFMDTKKLSISFFDASVFMKSNITIIDAVASNDKANAKNTIMLSEYSVSKMGSGTFTLDFEVKDKVSVDFVYNELLDVYEIHLEKGKSNRTAFSRNFEKLEGEILRIDFVNHRKTYNAKGYESKSVVVSRRKPRVIIVDDFGA